MIKLYLRPSQLVRFQDYQNDVITYSELVDSDSGLDAPSQFQEIGTAFHSMVERGVNGSDKYQFTTKALETAQMIGKQFQYHEMLAWRVYELPIAQIVINGTCDGISGDVIHEVKTRHSYISWEVMEKYKRSVQNLCYSYLFHTPTVMYHIVNLKAQQGIYEVTDYRKFDVVNNDAEGKLRKVLFDWVDFVICNDLQMYFKKPKQGVKE